MTTPATHEARSVSRPSFRERVHALAGHSTWREPAQPGSVDARRSIPTDHLIAAALAFGRHGKTDIGPDIAFDMATGRMGHHRKVCESLGRALSGDRSRVVVRNRPYIAVVAWAGYSAAVLGQTVPRPDGCAQDDWDVLVPAAALILERLAEDALALASRRARRAA